MEILSFLSLDSIQYLVNFASYVIVSFIGSLIKEMHWSNTDSKHDFTPLNVVASTMTASSIALIVSQVFKDFLDQYWGIMGLISLLLGYVGYQFFKYISDLYRLIKLIIFKEVSVEDVEEAAKEEKKASKNHSGKKKKKKSKSTEDEDDDNGDEPPRVRVDIPEIPEGQIEFIHFHVRKPEIHKPNGNKDISYKKEPTE